MSHRAVAVVIAVFFAGFASFAQADVRADFEAGRSHFGNGRYDKAVEVFSAMLAQPLDSRSPEARKHREILQAARPLHAASLVALGRIEEADRTIYDQLRDDPFYEPPAGQLPEPVVRRFIEVAAKHAVELDALRQRILLERQDAVLREQRERDRQQTLSGHVVEVEVVEVSRRSRLLAMVPFGVGQFQNGRNSLGTFFAVTEALGATAAFGSLVVSQHFAAADCRLEDCVAAMKGFEAARAANWISASLTGALMIAGVVEAQVSLVPEARSTFRRPAPRASLTPWASPLTGGALFGLSANY